MAGNLACSQVVKKECGRPAARLRSRSQANSKSKPADPVLKQHQESASSEGRAASVHNLKATRAVNRRAKAQCQHSIVLEGYVTDPEPDVDSGRATVRNMRSKCRCSYVLQFTFRRAVCCVLHRPPSQVIHCTVSFFNENSWPTSRARSASHGVCTVNISSRGGEHQETHAEAKLIKRLAIP